MEELWSQEFLIGWVGLFVLPKLAVLPFFRWLRQAERDTARQDAIDAVYLAALAPGDAGGGSDDAGDDEGGLRVTTRFGRRRPRPQPPAAPLRTGRGRRPRADRGPRVRSSS